MSENPYRPPTTQVEANPTLPRHPGQGSPYGAFRETGGLSMVLIFFLVVYFAASLVPVLTSWLDLGRIDRGVYGESDGESTMLAKVDLAVTNFITIFFYVTALIWAIWANKTCKNAWLINSRDGATAIYRGRDSYTSAWTVGWYFVPVASLWKPYQAMAWIRDASQKPLGLTMGKLLGLWWGFWILSAVTSVVTQWVFSDARSTEEIGMGYRLYIAMSPFGLAGTVFAILVVHRLTKIQKIRATDLGLRSN